MSWRRNKIYWIGVLISGFEVLVQLLIQIITWVWHWACPLRSFQRHREYHSDIEFLSKNSSFYLACMSAKFRSNLGRCIFIKTTNFFASVWLLFFNVFSPCHLQIFNCNFLLVKGFFFAKIKIFPHFFLKIDQNFVQFIWRANFDVRFLFFSFKGNKSISQT